MKILVINAGSSSLKYQLFDMETGKVLAKGVCEKIGLSGIITHKRPGADPYKAEHPLRMQRHSEFSRPSLHPQSSRRQIQQQRPVTYLFLRSALQEVWAVSASCFSPVTLQQ